MHRILTWTGKGGTGKTTTVANLGPELARLGHDVLMVGFDPQGDLEATFGIEDDDLDIVRVEALLDGSGDPVPAAVDIEIEDCAGRLRLLACSSELSAHSTAVARRGYSDLGELLEAFDDVDVALIDTQGALTPLSHTAAGAADGVLFSIEPGSYEYRALGRRLEEIDQINEERGWQLAPLGILFVRTTARSRQLREYREHFSNPEAFGSQVHVFDTHVRQQASVRDHPRFGRPTVLVEPNSNVARDYRAVAEQLASRLAATASRS